MCVCRYVCLCVCICGLFYLGLYPFCSIYQEFFFKGCIVFHCVNTYCFHLFICSFVRWTAAPSGFCALCHDKQPSAFSNTPSCQSPDLESPPLFLTGQGWSPHQRLAGSSRNFLTSGLVLPPVLHTVLCKLSSRLFDTFSAQNCAGLLIR